MSNTRANTGAFINDEQYSSFIYTNLHDMILPGAFTRNVSDFGSGTTLNIKTIGTRTIQDREENEETAYSPIDSNTISMVISEHVSDAFYITDEMREDGTQVEALIAQTGVETARAIAEDYETKMFQAAYDGQTLADPNDVNGFSHRMMGGGTNETLLDFDLIKMQLAFDKANVPMAGRVAIVDPVTAAVFNAKIQLTAGIDRTPEFMNLWRTGFKDGHQFLGNIYGWNIMVSNRLPRVASGTDIDGTDTTTKDGIANLFMCIADDNCKPIMSAWRRTPRSETERNKDRMRDETITSARYGFGNARKDTLGVIVTSASDIV